MAFNKITDNEANRCNSSEHSKIKKIENDEKNETEIKRENWYYLMDKHLSLFKQKKNYFYVSFRHQKQR